MNVIIVFPTKRNRDGREASKQGQHLVVGGVIGDEESQVGVTNDGGDANEACATAGDDADIFPRVLGGFSLAVVGIVEVCDCDAEGLDSGCWAVFAC